MTLNPQGAPVRAGWPGLIAAYQDRIEVPEHRVRLDAGLSVLPYFPLAYGLLTGKYAPGSAPEGAHRSPRRREPHDRA